MKSRNATAVTLTANVNVKVRTFKRNYCIFYIKRRKYLKEQINHVFIALYNWCLEETNTAWRPGIRRQNCKCSSDVSVPVQLMVYMETGNDSTPRGTCQINSSFVFLIFPQTNQFLVNNSYNLAQQLL